MSREVGLNVLAGRARGERIPVMEHLWGLAREAILHFSGIDPVREPQRVNEAFKQLAETFEVDLVWGGGLPEPDKDEIYDWSDGRTVRSNHQGHPVVQWGVFGATHQEDGRHLVQVPKPASVNDALAFEPLQYFPETVDQYAERFSRQYQRMLASCGTTCQPVPHHYTTAFHWPLAIFGFELLCEAGMVEDRFARLMKRFAEISRRITLAWARVPGLAGFILHDDLTMTSGPIFPPAWYRRHIFSHYPAIFEPLKRANIPIIFTSDGDCSCFVDDIFAAGADGLNFEYMVDMNRLVCDYPDRILIGNMNSGVLATGPKEAITQEVRRCLETGARAPRFVLNVGGQLTHDIPIEHLEHYLSIRCTLSRELADLRLAESRNRT